MIQIDFSDMRKRQAGVSKLEVDLTAEQVAAAGL